MDSKELQKHFDEIEKMYLQENYSSTDIAKHFKVKRYQINYLLEKNGIQKTFSQAKRKYTLNENYFDKIDTPNKAYILGFLYADGYNNDINHAIVLRLSEKDENILEAIKKEVGCNKPLYSVSKVNESGTISHFKTLVLASKHMSEKVKEYGLIPNKTFVITFPDFLPENLYSHFIRGYFDGDGCICRKKYYKNGIMNKERIYVTIMSSYTFCEGLRSYLLNKGMLFYLEVPSGHSPLNGILRVSKKETIKKFENFIYQDADLFLSRKKDKFLEPYFEE